MFISGMHHYECIAPKITLHYINLLTHIYYVVQCCTMKTNLA